MSRRMAERDGVMDVAEWGTENYVSWGKFELHTRSLVDCHLPTNFIELRTAKLKS